MDGALASEKSGSQSQQKRLEITIVKQSLLGQNLPDFNFPNEFEEDEEHYWNRMS